MRYPLNIATRPFRRDRAALVASGLVSLALAGVLVMLISLILLERGRLAQTRADVARLERRLRTLSAEQASIEGVLLRPENAEVLERSVFLNNLLHRKGISWTRIFADLEKIVPYNVRVMSIRPTVNAANQISLEMNLGSEATEPIVETLMRLEASEVFGATYVHNSLPPSQTEPLYRYRVSVNYAQKL
jgi:Tfp pilus assembly protein PilN